MEEDLLCWAASRLPFSELLLLLLALSPAWMDAFERRRKLRSFKNEGMAASTCRGGDAARRWRAVSPVRRRRECDCCAGPRRTGDWKVWWWLLADY